MPEPIDKDKLITAICIACSNGTIEIEGCESETCAIQKLINEQPTIEAEFVRHGRWINDTFCSECKRFPVDVSVSISNQELTKYFSRCPHCGARMDGGADNG